MLLRVLMSAKTVLIPLPQADFDPTHVVVCWEVLRAAGVTVALFAIFREYTGLWIASNTRVANSKMFTTDFPTAMAMAATLLEAGVLVVDCSADFRLRDLRVFASWYGAEHTAPGLLAQRVVAELTCQGD